MKIKHLNFEIGLKGNGIVNFDSGDQKYLWNRERKDGNKNKFTSSDDNNMYAKKTYFRNKEGKLEYKIKISSDALRNAIFKGDAIAINPSISHHKSLLYSFIGSPLGLIRGYMFAGEETIKRKSPLTITSAIQTNNAESHMNFHVRSGEKKKGDDSEKNDTTLFKREEIEEITYKAEGLINIQDLEFLSCDPIFDRMSFNADDYSILKTFLTNNLPNFNSELGYYSLKTSAIDVSEYGIKLNKEQIVYLIKEVLKRILTIKISKANSYAQIDYLTIELVQDALDSKKNKIVSIKSIEDIDSLEFDVEDFYVLKDESEAKKQRADIEAVLQEKAKKEATLKEEIKKLTASKKKDNK